ncbi:MAG: hypothetical protein AAFV72_02015 [Cyanobacteria bacterium J06635_1]
MVSSLSVFKGVTARSLLIGLLLITTLVAIAAVRDGIANHNMLMHFREGRLMDILSALLLLGTAGLSWRVFRVRYGGQPRFRWQAPFMVWAIVGVGFCFLAVDELTELHESLDIFLHQLLNLQPTALTDRLDDLLIALYALLGGGLLYLYRREIWRHRQMFPFLIGGFTILLLSTGLDVLTNEKDILSVMVRPALVDRFHIYLSILEELSKLFSESCFLAGFFAALQEAKQRRLDKASR